MSEYFIYYASFNIVGVIIFGIMLGHDLLGVDRQEKQVRYDNVLIAFMLYFISDSIWAGVDSGLFPANKLSVLGTNFLNFFLSSYITYTWIRYVMAVEKVKNRDRLLNRFLILLPVLLSIVVMVITYVINPKMLIDENFKTTGLFDFLFVCVPYLILIVVIIYELKKAVRENDSIEKRKHLYVGFFPIMVVLGGLLQILLMPTLPGFCFSCTIFMLIFFIQSLDDTVSTDPLTKLNNRGQLNRYVSQESNLRIEGKQTYIIMMDINYFKQINDTYGHSEGDRALIILSNALVQAVRSKSMPMFLARYGGDEFIIIAHPREESEIDSLKNSIREILSDLCQKDNKDYVISVGIGIEKLREENDSFSKCMQRADAKLYEDKERCKKELKGYS